MKKILILIITTTLILILAIQTQSITLSGGINFTAPDDTTIIFNRNASVENITIQPNSIILTNYQHNNSFYDSTGLTNTTNITWNDSGRTIYNEDFLNIFRFFDSLTGVYDYNYTFGSYQPLTYDLRVLYNIQPEGYYNWTYTGTSSTYLSFTEELYWNYSTHYDITYDVTKNRISLTFIQNGTQTTTSGRVDDINKSFRFNTSRLIIPVANLTQGDVIVRFNLIDGINHTQYYEWENELQNVSDTIELLESSDYSVHFEVSDYAQAPLEDVIIRAYIMEYENDIWVEKELIGQRLTQDDGITFFLLQENTDMFFSFNKDGYITEQLIITTGDEAFTRGEPIEIRMQQTDTSTTGTEYIITKPVILDTDTILPVLVYAEGHEKVEIQTNRRVASGLAPIDITDSQDILDYYTVDLTTQSFYNTPFLETIIWLILDDTTRTDLNTTRTTRRGTYNNTLFTFPDLANSRGMNIALFIGIVLISIILGLALRNPNIGLTSFTMGLILMSFITQRVPWALFIIGVYATLGALKKFYLDKE